MRVLHDTKVLYVRCLRFNPNNCLLHRLHSHQAQRLVISPQNSIHNHLQSHAPNPRQQWTCHFILPSHTLYYLRAVVHMLLLTSVFQATKFNIVTTKQADKEHSMSSDPSGSISLSVAPLQPSSIPAPTSEPRHQVPKLPSPSEDEITAASGAVERKGKEVATNHPKDIEMCEWLFIQHRSISDSHFSGGASHPLA